MPLSPTPQVLWTRYFLEAQGYTSDETIVYQDNKSAILLEENGTASSSKRTRHINIRYYFVTDRIANGEVSVEYCPTKAMVGDFFTKPLQGMQFTFFRDFIMNVDPRKKTVVQDHRSVLDEVITQEPTNEDDVVHVISGTEPKPVLGVSLSYRYRDSACGQVDSDGFTLVTRKHERRSALATSKEKIKSGKILSKSKRENGIVLSENKRQGDKAIVYTNAGKSKMKSKSNMSKAHYI